MQAPFTSILCATDFSDAGNAAVEVAYAMAGSGSTVHLLHFPEPQIRPGLPTAPPTLSDIDKRAVERLQRGVPASAQARGVRTETHVIDGPDDPVGILERESTRLKAEVIVVGSHGAKGWKGMLTGSVASGALKRCTAPVVLVRPHKK